MAFTIEGSKKNRGLGGLIAIVVSVGILLFATYYLFFTEPPQIEVFVPVELVKIKQISEVNIDPSGVINSSVFQSLKEHVGPPQLGIFGRSNPFSNF